MNAAALKNRFQRFAQAAESIFDAEEPIGQPTDLVMPRKRWFRRRAAQISAPRQVAAATRKTL